MNTASNLTKRLLLPAAALVLCGITHVTLFGQDTKECSFIEVDTIASAPIVLTIKEGLKVGTTQRVFRAALEEHTVGRRAFCFSLDQETMQTIRPSPTPTASPVGKANEIKTVNATQSPNASNKDDFTGRHVAQRAGFANADAFLKFMSAISPSSNQ